MKKVAIMLLLVFCLTGSQNLAGAQTIDPPIYGWSQTGHTYHSADLPNARTCPAMLDYYGSCSYHPYPAIDFLAPFGTPVRSVARGQVVLVNETPYWICDSPTCRKPGRFVVISHHRAGLPPLTVYKHLSSTLVEVGDVVLRGQVIGKVGHSQSPNNHLHFDAQISLSCFNTYECQVDYGTMRWCAGVNQDLPRTTDSSRLVKGRSLYMRPCR